MATIKEITLKCKAGETAAAYETALQDLNTEPDNIWVQREVGWALYYSIKEDVEKHLEEPLFEHLDKLSELSLLNAHDDAMLFENILWKITEFTKGIQKENFETLTNLFLKMQQFSFLPSRPYTLMLQYIIKFEGWGHMIEFIEWWNINNLLQEDFRQIELENGRKIMSVAERAHISYSKALIRQNDQERIQSFTPKLEALMAAHPDMIYLGYFCGKLLMSQGASREATLEKVLPFIKKKANEFWAWQLMSDIYADDSEKQLACLLRAIHCHTQESFLGKIRIHLADIYIARNDYKRAKHHIDKVYTCYQSQGWNIPAKLQQQTELPWLKTTNADSSDPIAYKSITDELIFSDISEDYAIVTYVDSTSRKAAIIFGLQKRAMIKYGRWGFNPKVGMILKMRHTTENGVLNIMDVEVSDRVPDIPYIKEVSGVVEMHDGKSFAFLHCRHEKHFMSPVIVTKYNIHGNETVKAISAYDFNKKKNMWNWSCISIVDTK